MALRKTRYWKFTLYIIHYENFNLLHIAAEIITQLCVCAQILMKTTSLVKSNKIGIIAKIDLGSCILKSGIESDILVNMTTIETSFKIDLFLKFRICSQKSFKVIHWTLYLGVTLYGDIVFLLLWS